MLRDKFQNTTFSTSPFTPVVVKGKNNSTVIWCIFFISGLHILKSARNKHHLKAERGRPSREEPAVSCLVHSFEFTVVGEETCRQILTISISCIFLDQCTQFISKPNARFLIIKPTRCTIFSNLFWNKILHVSDSSSVHHQEFITVHTAMVYVIQVLLTACELSAKPVWCASCVTHCQTHSQQRTLTQHDMLPQHPVNIMELSCECFKTLL